MSEQQQARKWNVVVPVVAVLRAPDGTVAVRRLAKALTEAGFDVYEEDIGLGPFESEDEVGESAPPLNGWPS